MRKKGGLGVAWVYRCKIESPGLSNRACRGRKREKRESHTTTLPSDGRNNFVIRNVHTLALLFSVLGFSFAWLCFLVSHPKKKRIGVIYRHTDRFAPRPASGALGFQIPVFPLGLLIL